MLALCLSDGSNEKKGGRWIEIQIHCATPGCFAFAPQAESS